MATVDAVDAHAWAMFCAGWKAGQVHAGLIGEGETNPTPRDFYLALPDQAARECNQIRAAELVHTELLAIQSEIRRLDRQAADLQQRMPNFQTAPAQRSPHWFSRQCMRCHNIDYSTDPGVWPDHECGA
mgnify:CR=1 FL=1